MTDAPITVDLDDRAVLDALRRLMGRLADLTPAMRGIGQEMESRISGRFESQTDPEGQPWADWSERYAEQRPLRYPDANTTILDRYGDMLDSLSHQATKDSATVGFGSAYAAYHEWGTEHMPRRGLIAGDIEAGTLAEDDRGAILDILEDVIRAAL